jgi:hypothetical protein
MDFRAGGPVCGEAVVTSSHKAGGVVRGLADLFATEPKPQVVVGQQHAVRAAEDPGFAPANPQKLRCDEAGHRDAAAQESHNRESSRSLFV